MDIETVKSFLPDLNDDRAALYLEMSKAAKPLIDAAKQISDPTLQTQILSALTQSVQLIARAKPLA